MPKVLSSPQHWYSSIISSVSQTSQEKEQLVISSSKLIHTYDNAFHGFSAMLSKELEAVKKLPGFLSSYKDNIVTPDTTHSSEFLGLNTATGLWPASQLGKDAIIGIVDTGIWPESASFRDDGMPQVPKTWKGICQPSKDFNSSLCNKKIIGARYFNQGARAAGDTTSVASARDTDGHGTHVASIAAGNFVDDVSFFGYAPGTARGVAPRARLAIYKVLWDIGVESDVLAGIDQAVADKVHVISVSIGFTSDQLYESSLAIASFGAREKGILVCFSAGNRGPNIRTTRSDIPWAVVVASSIIDRWFAGTLRLGNGKTITGWTTFPAPALVRNLPIVYNTTLSACDSDELLAQAPDDSIIICNITSEGMDFSSLMTFLSDSRVRASIIIADDPGIYRSSQFPHPGVVITPAQAREVVKYVSRSSSPRASIEFQQTILGKEARAAPALSASSSKGPGRMYEGILKPDIMAPGVLILAAYNPQISGARIGNTIDLPTNYTLLSGTSMACPHVSGTAALLKAAHPDWSPAAIQSAMMTTAYILDNTGQPIKDTGLDNTNATPLGIGSGHVDPNRALNPGLVYDASPQDFVNLVCSMNFTREQTRTIVRSSYTCSNPSSDLNYPSFLALFHVYERGKMVTRKFQRTLTNVGDGAATYRVKLETPVNSTVTISPQTLVFGKKYERKSFSLTVRFRADIDNPLKYGWITWIEKSGKYTVRSPVVLYGSLDNFE